ncbi:PASTA domain-containing protein [Mesorhizobium sp. B4-1-4]|uniref:PASTA domain-containing protein n=1 Tax=Mesorhizobium sp. B4-1-4 TaxID=2589888 RepID=UPI00112AC6FF|nr:PASTA domain-containing protein [Mesorhizobium sp. B4-1-4]UCI30800.1 PASTA domain-containing protein [Mesorhizobium sp. B4-1-4]
MLRVAYLSLLIISLAGTSEMASAETVPSLLGMQMDEAKAAADKSGVSLVIQKVDSLERREKILLQVPGVGSEIGTDRQIYVRVSDGMPVPDLVGKPETDAEAVLKGLGIGHESSDRRHDGLVRHTVAGQTPNAGDRLDASSEVVFLDVVGGRYVAVPNVAGQSLSNAMAAIRNGELSPVEDPPAPDLAATSQRSARRDCTGINVTTATAAGSDPAAGTEVYPGTSVKVTYQTAVTFQASNECKPAIDRDPCERNVRLCQISR